MSSDNHIENDDPSNLNAAVSDAVSGPSENIVSVNKKGGSDNKVGKAIFILVISAVLVGALTWFGQSWLDKRKAQMKASNGPRVAEQTDQVFNPEKTGNTVPKSKLGSDSGQPAPSQTAAEAGHVNPGAQYDDIRSVRGADGKVMVNAQGKAMGIDKNGNLVEVPAVAALDAEQVGQGGQSARKDLPAGSANSTAQGGAQGAKPPSRYAGSLFVGEPAKPSGAAPDSISNNPNTLAQTQINQIGELLRVAQGGTVPQNGASPRSPAATTTAVPAQQDAGKLGTVGGTLYASATPVARAKRIPDQNLMLPKGRQADCVLTGQIIDEVPGFTSCVLTQNMYGDNGRVVLLERGSELTGEYGVTNQLGLERIFVTWTRAKTPDGVDIDLFSPGADRLGTSGVPGNLDNRWGARIGAAFLLSFVKDITVAIINKELAPPPGGQTVNVMPGQNTINASGQLAEEVIKQTIKVRPRLNVNEGERISVYVARDLDFSPVYVLRNATSKAVQP